MFGSAGLPAFEDVGVGLLANTPGPAFEAERYRWREAEQ